MYKNQQLFWGLGIEHEVTIIHDSPPISQNKGKGKGTMHPDPIRIFPINEADDVDLIIWKSDVSGKLLKKLMVSNPELVPPLKELRRIWSEDSPIDASKEKEKDIVPLEDVLEEFLDLSSQGLSHEFIRIQPQHPLCIGR